MVAEDRDSPRRASSGNARGRSEERRTWTGGRRLGAATTYAGKVGAHLTCIVGEKGLAAGTVAVRDLAGGEQVDVVLDHAVAEVTTRVR